MQINKQWKRRLILSVMLLAVFSGGLIYLLLARFHFSTQMFWPLARLQWEDGGNVEYDGVYPKIIGCR